MPTPPHCSLDGLGEAASSPQAAIKTWKEVKEGSSSAERPARYFGCTAISPSGNVPCRRMAGPTLRRAGGEQAISAGRARSFVRCWAHLWGARPELAGVVFLALDYASPLPKRPRSLPRPQPCPLGHRVPSRSVKTSVPLLAASPSLPLALSFTPFATHHAQQPINPQSSTINNRQSENPASIAG